MYKYQFMSMFKLLFNYWKKSFHSIFFGFVFPLVMLVIIMAVNTGPGAANQVLPGLVMSASPVLGIVTLAMTYCDFKQSIIIKRIGAAPLKPSVFILSVLLFHVVLIFVGSFWILGIGTAIYHSQINLSTVNWGYVILSILFASIISSAIGLIIGVLAPDYKIANAFSLLLYLPTSFLSGQYLPISMLKNQNALIIIAKILPFSYPVNIMNRGWNAYGSSSVLNSVSLYNNYWISIVASLGWIVLFVGLAIFIYKNKKK